MYSAVHRFTPGHNSVVKKIRRKKKILPHPSSQHLSHPPHQPTSHQPPPQPPMMVSTQPLQSTPIVITLQPQYVIQRIGNYPGSQTITDIGYRITYDDCDDKAGDGENPNIDDITENRRNTLNNKELQTLLADTNNDENDTENIMHDERKLTELKELDLYYDFDYVSPYRNDYDRPPSRSLFEDEDIVEI